MVSRDCFHCVAACTDGCIYTYNLRTTELLDVFSASRCGPASVCFSRDEYFLFSAAKDTVKVWTFYKRHTRGIHTDDHTDHVTCIAISRDGKTAITGSKDKVVKLWNLDISDFLENLKGHEAAVTCVAMGDNEEFAASGSDDCTVKVWSVIMGCVITNYTEHESSINNILVVHERHLVLSSEMNGVIKLWQAEDGVTCMTLFGPVQWLCLAPNSQFAVSGSGAQSLKLWRVETGDICQSVNHADRITCVTFSGDSQYLVTGSADKSLKVWEAATGKLTQVLVEHTACVSCVAVSDSNRHVISGSHDTTLLVWGLSTGAVEHQLTGHTDHVTCVKLTSDGTTALSGSRDGCLHVWNMTYGLPVTVFDMHLAVLGVEMTPDAAHIVVQLERSQHVPLMCLHNSPAGEVKSQSQIEIQVLGGGPILPIKAKPLIATHPTARFMTSKLRKFTDLYPSVSSIPEIVKTPLQKAVKAQEQNKETRGQRSMFGSLRSHNSSKKTQHESKSGVCALL
ncbi:hypothetical protein NP493_35g01041 [Ridgeia piscesae]|uniref:Uncharacterized protein n=1 Tax=Ridgeia piscesae TaxID=27915 RepID=A0AAD9UJX2_RIDPI|nr:hypothetical protein NP493_35g01041 [Ridgeia piscesae]